MTLKEAYKILGASKQDDDREIKAKYKKLLILYHPDSDPTRERAPEDDEKIRQVIEAYKKIRESEGEPYFEPYEFTWDAFENKRAFSERNIFFQFKIYDEALPPSKMARGRFVWDPDMEEFPLFTKSVLEACKELITDHESIQAPDKVKDIFHLMMQEYILPADAARKLGKKLSEDETTETFTFKGFMKDDQISFDEDELYYVVLPLLENPKVNAHTTITKVEHTRRIKDRTHVSIELTIPKDLTDTPSSNADRIKELLH
ncbi:J domain-containing protein [Butyrivibrio sp. AE2032]|uniref:J domain-containing protein n=1 Tax=Butyrivibrio sp. AE2032 TaxID=1458463 RepID=UPI00068D43FE|nr:J domain-containing protein [Butyrivibrio sp. AE2032]